MAILSGNVFGPMEGVLGDFYFRTRYKRQMMCRMPSKTENIPSPELQQNRVTFGLNSSLASKILSLDSLKQIWENLRYDSLTPANLIISRNYQYFTAGGATDKIIITPEGFNFPPAQIDKEDLALTVTISEFSNWMMPGGNDSALSLNVVFYCFDPKTNLSKPHTFTSQSKEIPDFNFNTVNSIQIDFQPEQKKIIDKYNKYIIYLAAVFLDERKKVTQFSSTFSQTID